MRKIAFLILSLFLMMFHQGITQTHIWTGNGSGGNWDDANNWNVGTVPDASSDVLIPGGFGVTIENTTASANSIEIQGDSGLSVFYDLSLVSQLNITALASFRFFGGTLSGGGSIDNDGLIEFLGPDQKEVSNIIINNHHLFWIQLANQILIKNNTVINNHPTGELLIASVGGFLNQGTQATLNNDGLLRKLNDGINPTGNFYLILDIYNSGTIQVDEDEIFLILGGGLDFHNLETGIIQGRGTYDITANFTNEGITSPAASNVVGTLNITNNFVVDSNGVLEIDINGSDPAAYDSLDVFGSPLLEGSIAINLEYHPTIGDEFVVLTANLGIGSCNFPQYTTAIYMDTEYTFEVICNSNEVVLKVVDQTMGINDNASGSTTLLLTPNPVEDVVEIIISQLGDITFSSETPIISIYNSLGQLVKQVPIKSEATNLDVSIFQSGLYIVQIEVNDQVIANSKLIIR